MTVQLVHYATVPYVVSFLATGRAEWWTVNATLRSFSAISDNVRVQAAAQLKAAVDAAVQNHLVSALPAFAEAVWSTARIIGMDLLDELSIAVNGQVYTVRIEDVPTSIPVPLPDPVPQPYPYPPDR